MAKRKSSPASTYTSGEQLTLEMDIEPLEELVVTVESFDEQIGNMLLHTDMTRRRGLHWITDRRGERVLVDESAVMDSGPKMGTTLCYTPHPAVAPTEEERAANRAEIKRIAAQVMVGMGIW